MQVFKVNRICKLFMFIIALFVFGMPVDIDANIDVWKMDEFMVSVWGGVGENPYRFFEAPSKTIKQTNVNVVMTHQVRLGLCRQLGIKALLLDVEPSHAAQYRNDPAVWGYFLTDEPTAKDYQTLADKVRQFWITDPSHPTYINLGEGLTSQHNKYLEMVRPSLLSYDYYPWSWGFERYFERLEEYRNGALKYDIPLLSFISPNTATKEEIKKYGVQYVPNNNQERLRFVLYTTLAYGIKGIQWFHGRGVWDVSKNYELTTSGRDIALLNSELRILGESLIKMKSTMVFHTAPIPKSTQLIPKDFWLQVYDSGLMIGVFEDNQAKEYIMIVNKDYTKQRFTKVSFPYHKLCKEKLNKVYGTWTEEAMTKDPIPELLLSINPGDGELLKCNSISY